MQNVCILIPARLAATRLPRKPLADIGGTPMIVHVWGQAAKAGLGDVAVACDCEEIAAPVRAAGGVAILTDPALPSGSDRIWAALKQYEKDKGQPADLIINLQGDLPLIEPADITAALAPLASPEVDIATLVAPITTEEERNAPQVVKAVLEIKPGEKTGRALYFSRAAVPTGDGPLWHHVGIYAYRRAALEKFVRAPQAELEKQEKLEQLRALALGLRIDAAIIEKPPLGVDTPADLEKVRALAAQEGKK